MITPLLLCLVPFLPPLLAQSSASPNLRKTPPLQGFFPGSTTPHPTGHVPTLEDIANDESFVNHDLLLAAARSPSNVGAMTYAVDFPQDNYQYILEMEAETTSRLWSLDDNYGHIHSFTDDGTHPGATVIVYPTAPFTFAVGDYIIGSHLGQWNDLVTVDHPFDYGITYSRKVTSVALVDGVRKLTTTAAHPQETLARSYMRMDLNFTEEKPMPARRLENDEDLKDWCKDACLSRSYYEKDGDLVSKEPQAHIHTTKTYTPSHDTAPLCSHMCGAWLRGSHVCMAARPYERQSMRQVLRHDEDSPRVPPLQLR